MAPPGRSLAPDWVTLRIFLTAIGTGSLTRAAAERGIAVSAAAKRVQALEEECGCRLLERHARGVVPTAAGIAFARHARSLLDLSARLSDEMHAFAAGGGGSVRLHATTSAIVGHDLGPILLRFAAARPGIAVEMREVVSADILRDLVEGRADLGVVTSGAAVPPGVEAHPWREDRLFVVMAPGHALAGAATLDFATVLDHPLIGAVEGGALSLLLGREAARLGRDLRYRFRVAGTDASRALVAAGLGIGIMPEGMWRPFQATGGGGLVGVPLDEAWALRPLHLVSPTPERRSAPAGLLLRWLLDGG